MFMLVLTENAMAAIRSLVDRADLPESTGVRISTTADSQALSVSTAPIAEDGDQVLGDDDARLFLEPAAATLLDNKVLDARFDDRGRVEFLLGTQ
jgi:iron-sulfur cluster assembly protein